MSYSIGAFNFDNLEGPVVLPKTQIDLEAYTGQDGVAAFASGTRGVQFQMQSRFYATSWANAVILSNSYRSALSLTGVNIVRGSETYLATDYKFLVLDVNVMQIKANVAWQGYRSNVLTNIAPAFLVEAIWTLVAIDTSLVIGEIPTPP